MAIIQHLINLCNNDIVLLGAIQELAQHRENPLTMMRPCSKYVRQNNIDMQHLHVKSE